MVLGTASDVGKSLMTAGIGRILARAGVRVALFKAQNMANNAVPALMPDGRYGEIGTAQGLQARACGVLPRVEMNPVLLKSGGQLPSGKLGVQVVHLGQVIATEDWRAYQRRHLTLMDSVLAAHARLVQLTQATHIIAEGAGSCTELNLMAQDIVNIPLARRLQCPWLLVADIDRGGVFAQVVGTKAVLPAADWQRCVGVVVNRLRGDPSLFTDGAEELARRCGKPVWVVPHLPDLNVPDEDGVATANKLDRRQPRDPSRRQIFVCAYPHLAMAADITALESDPSLQVHWCRDQIPDMGLMMC